VRVLISGSTGLIGTALVESLRADGHSIGRLARPATRAGPAGSAAGTWIRWDPAAGELDSAAAEGADAVVNLAGASIGGGRWSPTRKRLLRNSRVEATRSLIESLSHLARPPRVFVSASAVGYFGDRGDEELTEQSSPGDDFLAQLCVDWEAAAMRAAEFGARVSIVRFGIVLAAKGGALAQMLLPFRLGLGGRLGSGKQWMSWIALQDATNILRRVLDDEHLSGVVHAVAPGPVRNVEFTAALARVLHRPAILPAPGFALRLVLGEMAEALLLSSQHVIPARLKEAGHPFELPGLIAALGAVLS